MSQPQTFTFNLYDALLDLDFPASEHVMKATAHVMLSVCVHDDGRVSTGLAVAADPRNFDPVQVGHEAAEAAIGFDVEKDIPPADVPAAIEATTGVNDAVMGTTSQ